MFLEFPGRLDTGSLFLLVSRPVWGQAGHVLPPAEKQLSGEPSPIVLSAQWNKERPGLDRQAVEHTRGEEHSEEQPLMQRQGGTMVWLKKYD